MSDTNNVFRPQYRELGDEEKERVEAIKDKALELYNLFDFGVQENQSIKGRYNELAKKALEESVMWAVKSITS